MSLAPRPHFHFAPARNWMNDPNGLIFYRGKYHLFFQYNPEGNQWGNMSWGHSTSTDLIHWQELPVAISYTPTHAIFSGSAVVDYFNTTGFGSLENPAMVAIFTAHQHDGLHQVQSLAYSTDEGLTWQHYEGNPILDLEMKDFRDPKVVWNTVNEAWVMSVVKPHEFTVAFYQSKDLKQWELLSEFSNKNGTDGVWECPDLFPVAVDGDSTKIKWVLFISVNPGGVTGGSGTQFFIGDWNGKEFVADDVTTRWLDYGRDNYAGVTFNDAPDNRRIYLGWMNNWDYAKDIPANPARGSMTIPRELSLVTIDGKVTLLQNPVKEILGSGISDQTFTITPMGSKTGIRFTNEDGKSFDIGYDPQSLEIYIDRSSAWYEIESTSIHAASFDPDGKPFEIRVIIDTGSVELFVAGGRLSITDLLLPSGSTWSTTPF
jgi:sucrose-6-phosphate hydrolase SacC (GH32 family)